MSTGAGVSTTTRETVADLGIERLVRIEQRVSAAEDTGVHARWEFGHELRAVRGDAKQLPKGYLAEVERRTGCGRVEAQRRLRFADRFETEDEVCHAVTHFGSWHQIVNVALARPAEDAPLSEAPLDVPEGKFATFVADPPWRYGNTSTRGAAEDHYDTMSIEDLCALDVVPERAADQAHLYLWATAGHLPQAFTVMEAWGFDYKTYLVWTKPQMGMGNYFRVSTELVLFGVKGGLRTNHRGLKNYFEARRGKHSAKPTVFRDLVMQASFGPYLELFSRCRADRELACDCSKCRDGWTVWGDQA